MTQETRDRAPMLVVPDIVGLRVEDAESLLLQAGFPEARWHFTETYELAGTVVDAEPLPGTMVRGDRRVTLHVSQQSLIRYLPTVFQEGRASEDADFLKRFLWIAQHMYQSVERRVEHATDLLNPYTVDEEFLPWLSSWVALSLDEDWPLPKKRRFLKRASRLFCYRGTARSLIELVEVFTGVRPKILENEWPYDGFRIGVTSTIAEDSIILPPMNLAYCFVVKLPVPYDQLEAGMLSKIHDIIQGEKPAHTMYFLQFEGDTGVTEDPSFVPIGMGMRIGATPEVVGEA